MASTKRVTKAQVQWTGAERTAITGADQWWPQETRLIDDPAQIAGYQALDGFVVTPADATASSDAATAPDQAAAPDQTTKDGG